MPDPFTADPFTERLARHLKQLRLDKGWSLEQLAERSGVSRASLSRLENASGSPTTELLGKLCTAYGLTLSRLMAQAEEAFRPVIRRDAQPLWKDVAAGFERRAVSPPHARLAAEVIRCHLAPDSHLAYESPSLPGMEHHLILLDGALQVEIERTCHDLLAGDCLRYQLFGASTFRTPADQSATYIMVMI